jgi:hypothetical protein
MKTPLLSEYISKMKQGWGAPDFETELSRLINEYNKLRKSFLFVFSTATEKRLKENSLAQSDYYVIHDLLRNKNNIKKLDVYIETPGGSGEAAEEIVRFFRSKFEEVHFIVAGEAKSAGTILVLSGDEIYMTDTGSLSPIDAQVLIGRSVASAHDYMQWVNDTRKGAESSGHLNPFDAIMVAQITPGELGHVDNALKFAEDLVQEWLQKYKFKNWNKTETRGIDVTPEMKAARATEIAKALTNHSKWRMHGRSIKISDLDEIGLIVHRVDNDEPFADLIYRIQTVCRMLFDITNTYKIFCTTDKKIFRRAIPQDTVKQTIPVVTPNSAQVVEADVQCPQCGKNHKIYAKFIDNPQIDRDFSKKGSKPFPKDAKMKCDCGFEIDLMPAKNMFEQQVGKKIVS